MIRYSLRCDQGHEFDGWFRSSADFDRQNDAHLVTCSQCGSAQISKMLMAPNVATSRPAGQPLAASESDAETALKKLRAQIEKDSDYVGMSFATEARAIHDGLAPERPIHGEARIEDARKLLEDGIAIAPLPFTPRQRVN